MKFRVLIDYANKLLTLQDMIHMQLRGEFETKEEIPEEYLHKIRLELQKKYLSRLDMSQSEADGYNGLYYDCQICLEEISEYDGSGDLWIDFDYLVPYNKSYGMKILGEV